MSQDEKKKNPVPSHFIALSDCCFEDLDEGLGKSLFYELFYNYLEAVFDVDEEKETQALEILRDFYCELTGQAREEFDEQMEPVTDFILDINPLYENSEEKVTAFALHVDNFGDTEGFEERFRGCYDTFKEYSDNLAEECDMTGGEAQKDNRYLVFDYEAFARDLEHDYCVCEVEGKVYIFENY